MILKTILEGAGLIKAPAPRPVIRFASCVGNFAMSKVSVIKEAKSLAGKRLLSTVWT